MLEPADSSKSPSVFLQVKPHTLTDVHFLFHVYFFSEAGISFMSLSQSKWDKKDYEIKYFALGAGEMKVSPLVEQM